MTAGASSDRETDPELVRAIVNKLKSGGSFDQFRREFIADVDTKPAYQNLQQRVESYVNRFLSQQKWSPKLNKNQLRENLRRQINQSGMLNKGVERIIEQVVNPKIMQIIKPKIDEVTCDHLGISLEERNNRQKQKQLEQQEKMMKSPESGGIASLMSLTFTSPPPGVKTPSFLTSSPPPQFTPSSSSGILGPAPPQFAPQMGFPNPPAASLPFPGLSQQSFPFMPPGWSVSMNAGFPPMFPPASQIGGPFQDFRMPPPGSGLAIPPQAPGSIPPSSDGTVPPGSVPVPAAAGPITPAAGVILPPGTGVIPPGTGVIPPAAGGILMPPVPLGTPIASTSTLSTNTTKPSPGKGLNALLGLPTPSEEPPPPGTVVLPDGTHIKKIWKPESQDEFVEKTEEVVMENSYVDCREGHDERNDFIVDSEDTQVVIMDEIPLPESSTKQIGDEQTVAGESKRYKFAWDEDIDVGSDIEDDASSHVSSVHTSDLSNFEESNSSSDSDVEELENKLLLLQKEREQKEEDQANLDTTEEGGTLETDVLSDDIKTDNDQHVPNDVEETKTVEMVSAEPSPVKQPPVQTSRLETTEEQVDVQPVNVAVSGKEKKELSNKPRKLLSLQYNYSDSEDDESREDRKARIAREKEERYLKRLQRRAEMEAKRKEREEEKNRQRRERLERAKAEKEKLEKEKGNEGMEEEKMVEKEKEPTETTSTEPVEFVTEKNQVSETVIASTNVAEDEVPADKEETLHVKEIGTHDDNKDADLKVESVETEQKLADEVDEKRETEVKVNEPDKVEKIESTEKDVIEEVEENTIEKKEEEEFAKEVVKDSAKVEEEDTSQVVTDKTELKEESRNTSLNTDSSHTGDSSVHVDTSVSESASPEKKMSKQRKKTKEELKAELKEQKVLERRSRRQRIRNRKYMSDEFVFKSPSASLCQSYDETMVIEETVEMEITTDGTEPQTYDVEGGDVHLVEIPLPEDQITMETVEYDEVAMVQDGEEVVMVMDGGELITSAANLAQGSTDYTEGVAEYEVTSADINSSDPGRVTRSQSKFNDDIKSNSSEVSDQSLDGRKRRRRNTSQSSSGEPSSRKMSHVSVREGRQLRSSDHKSEKFEQKASGSKKSYDSDDLYKPRHSFSRPSLTTPPPLPDDQPPLPSEPSLPPLPPLPPPPAEGDEIPPPPSSPQDSGDERRSRKRSRSTISSGSDSRSRKDKKKSKKSRSRSLSSISSDSKVSRSRSRSKSRSRSSSRSYSRSRSRTKSSSRSRSVSRSRSRSFSSVSSNESNLSDSERERRRKARPLEDVDFGEAAKRARQDSMMIPFGPRGPAGPMGPRMPMGQMGPRGPIGPGAFPPGRGMSPIGARGPRVVGPRGWFPSPHQIGPDGSPIRQPCLSPAKPYYPQGSSTHYTQPGSSWDGTIGSRPRTTSGIYEDEYFKPDDIHEGPGKTGITERGTLYREDTSPSPPPERRPVYSPPPIYREGSLSPGITGITERGTLYREDKSPTPPGVYRGRRVERSLSPPPRPRIHGESLTPSPPPIARRRARGSRSDSFESISPSPPPVSRTRQLSPVQRSPIQRSPLQRSPVQRNTPPVLYKPRTNTADASPPSSGELTPSPPDISQLNEGRPNTPPSPVSPHSLRSATPMFDEVQDFPTERSPRGSITPTPSIGSNEGMLSSPEEGALPKLSRKRPRSPESSRSSPGEALDSPPQLRRSARHQELSEGEMSPKARRRKLSPEGTSKIKTRKSKRKKSKK